MIYYIFDIDGTLTPSRQPIVEDFKTFFLEFVKKNRVSLVTGSDMAKSVEQLGNEILDNIEFCFNCSGNDVYLKGQNIHKEDWQLPDEDHEWLSKKLTESKFPVRSGLHFEHRTGTCNFSVVGRNADLDQRFMYVIWDTEKNERQSIAEQFVKVFPEIEAKIGGETGIDLYPKGKDKSQIIDYISDNDILFFGDKMEPDENDYPLAHAIEKFNLGESVTVHDYKQTWKFLKKIYD